MKKIILLIFLFLETASLAFAGNETAEGECELISAGPVTAWSAIVYNKYESR